MVPLKPWENNVACLDLDKIPLLDCISDYVDFYAEKTPDAEAAMSGDEHITYADLKNRVDQCARSLLSLGVKKGDRVATLAAPNLDFYVTFLASVSIGAIWLGLNPKYKVDEYRYVIGDAAPVIIFVQSEIEQRQYDEELKIFQDEFSFIRHIITFDGQSHLSYADFITQGHDALEEERNAVKPEDAAIVVYTSGTTGQPKGAILAHRGLTRCSHIQLSYWNVSPIRSLNFLPINHVGCVGDICSYILVGGGTIIFMEKFDPVESLALVEKEKVTIWGGVPTTFQICLNLPNFNDYDMSSVQMIVWSGAAAPLGIIEKLEVICPQLSSAYGMTETVGSVTFAGPCQDKDVLANSIGKPVPSYDVRILKDDGTMALPNEQGEIQVRGDFIMLGYLNRPEQTRECYTDDGWFKTGDLAELRPDGNWRLTGRLKEMFKSGGYNVYPREVEILLEQHPDVAMAAVIGVAHPLYDEVGHGYILLEKNASATAADLKSYCDQNLANYKIPKKFFISHSLPMLAIGKIDKNALKKKSSEVAPI